MSNLTKSDLSFQIQPKRFSPKIIFASSMLILSSTASLIICKTQTQMLYIRPEQVSFQILFAFFGQFINFLYFYAKIIGGKQLRLEHFTKYKNLALLGGKEFYFSTNWIMMAALMQIIKLFLQMYSLSLMSIYLFLVFQSVELLLTIVLQKLFLRKDILKHTIVGSVVIIFGSALQFIIQLAFKGENDKGQDMSIPVLMMSLATVLGSA